jgi:hypothetical protein
MVAAAAALLWRMVPGLSAAQVQSILCSTAVDVTTAPAKVGKDVYTGAGALDVYGAVDFAQGLPIEPTISTLTAGKGSVKVTWKVSAAQQAALTGFVVERRLASGGAWKTKTVNGGSARSATVTGLSEGVSYEFRVAGRNSRGVGSYSPEKKKAPWLRKIKTSKSSLRVKRRKKVALYVATYFGKKEKMTISWKSSKRKVAVVTSTGAKAAKKGKGSWKKMSLTGSASVKKGKKIYIKGLKRGTATITFTSGKVKKTVKVRVR